MVAAISDPRAVAVLRNEGGALSSLPLLATALPAATPNGVRKLFQLNRVDTITAIMHDVVLVPEGRTDYDWLKLLVPLHRGFDELIMTGAQRRQRFGIDQHRDASRDAGLTSDQPAAFEREHHLVD